MITDYVFSTSKIAELDSDDDKEEEEIETDCISIPLPLLERGLPHPPHSSFEGNYCVSNELEQIITNVKEENTHGPVVVSLPLLPQGRLGTVSIDMNCTELGLTCSDEDEETSIEDERLPSSDLSLTSIRVNSNNTRRTYADIELDSYTRDRDKEMLYQLGRHRIVLFCTLLVLSMATMAYLLSQERGELSFTIVLAAIGFGLLVLLGLHIYLCHERNSTIRQFEQRRNRILRNNS
ncbi:putative membrane protein [Candidatus Ichthyocystis hellenicum]|uniref:Putative membrane protein n=2 Tax=Candidatus Ichthyocystis TaxID=2929841 RepID=A0A0S4M7Q3_9BURK|nr:hypothetical protein [Candidatus Ichthyocystis hellenicum]CUT18310.1 putative membrane protein [Candidatus Ichthyocystis hellenicum]